MHVCLITADKETQIRSDDYGRDLSSVQTLLTKQETFDAGLQAFEKEGIQTITALKDQLIASNHAQTPAIERRYNDVITRSVMHSTSPRGSHAWIWRVLRLCEVIVLTSLHYFDHKYILQANRLNEKTQK